MLQANGGTGGQAPLVTQEGELTPDGIRAAINQGDYRAVFPGHKEELAEELVQQQQNQQNGDRLFLGRYRDPVELETFARQMQSRYDQFVNGAPGVLFKVAEQNPVLYEIAERLAKGEEIDPTMLNGGNNQQQQQQSFAVKPDDLLRDDGFGGKALDPEKLVAAINKAVEHGATLATSRGAQQFQGNDPQLVQAVNKLALQQQYLMNGLPVGEINEDVQMAAELAQMSELDLVQVARMIRTGQLPGAQQDQAFQVRQGQSQRLPRNPDGSVRGVAVQMPAQPVSLMGSGARGRMMTRQQQQAQQIVSGGAKTQRSLFKRTGQ